MAVTLQKWGNSVGVRLPRPMLEQVGLKEGSQVEVLVEGDHLVIRRKRLKLADLLARCKPGEPAGSDRLRTTGGPGDHLMARAGYVPACGDFVRVVLDPRVGREQSGERPALVLSDREFNAVTGYIFCAPVTGTRRGWPFEVSCPFRRQGRGSCAGRPDKEHRSTRLVTSATSRDRRQGLSRPSCSRLQRSFCFNSHCR